jgi:hypothetical protein
MANFGGGLRQEERGGRVADFVPEHDPEKPAPDLIRVETGFRTGIMLEAQKFGHCPGANRTYLWAAYPWCGRSEVFR